MPEKEEVEKLKIYYVNNVTSHHHQKLSYKGILHHIMKKRSISVTNVT